MKPTGPVPSPSSPSEDASSPYAPPARSRATATPTPELAVRPKRVRVQHLAQMRQAGQKIVMLTAYDAVTAALIDAAGTDMILVGDSIGNVAFGYDSTLPVTLEEMVVATRSVARATRRALVVADMPFGTYEAGPAQALDSAVRLMRVGAGAVKLEGGAVRAQTVRALTDAGIPVVAHVGFTPQSVNALGGFRVQGRGDDAAAHLSADVAALAEAGAIAVVLEMVTEPVAAQVTQSSPIPTIGIGSGARCDGQVLVWADMAGMTEWTPRFATQFGQVGQALRQAAEDFGSAVRAGSFPAPEHWFDA